MIRETKARGAIWEAGCVLVDVNETMVSLQLLGSFDIGPKCGTAGHSIPGRTCVDPIVGG